MRWLMLFSVFLISACSTTSDPRDANLFEAMAGLGSGEYKRQSERDRAELKMSQQEREAATAHNTQLQSHKDDLAYEKRRLAHRVNALAKRSKTLSAQIRQLRSRNDATQQQKLKLQQRIDHVNTGLQDLQDQNDSMDINIYKKKYSELQQEVDDLTTLLQHMT